MTSLRRGHLGHFHVQERPQLLHHLLVPGLPWQPKPPSCPWGHSCQDTRDLEEKPFYLRSAGPFRRKRWAENQDLRVQAAQLPPLWSLEVLAGEHQPGDGMSDIRTALTLASSLMGPASTASAQSCSSHLTLASCLGSSHPQWSPVSYFLIYFSWLFHFLGCNFFFFISSSSISFSQVLSTCPWKNVVKFEMALTLEKWLFLIYAMPIFKKVLKALRIWHVLNMKLKNKNSPKMKVMGRGDNYSKAKNNCD